EGEGLLLFPFDLQFRELAEGGRRGAVAGFEVAGADFEGHGLALARAEGGGFHGDAVNGGGADLDLGGPGAATHDAVAFRGEPEDGTVLVQGGGGETEDEILGSGG